MKLALAAMLLITPLFADCSRSDRAELREMRAEAQAARREALREARRAREEGHRAAMEARTEMRRAQDELRREMMRERREMQREMRSVSLLLSSLHLHAIVERQFHFYSVPRFDGDRLRLSGSFAVHA
jgi:hypothetical protein